MRRSVFPVYPKDLSGSILRAALFTIRKNGAGLKGPRGIPLFLAVIALFFLSSPIRAAEQNPLNFILITIDTIRADHLGCYGYKKIKTPNIDRLSEKGILFENAFTPVPLTLPSHTSILTGTCPSYHGIRNNGTYAVAESAVTLAELFKTEGYSTAAFVSAYVLDKRFGLTQGFDIYNDDLSEGEEGNILDKERRAEAVTKEVIQWLKGRPQGKFFLWVHYFDPHMHYAPPPPFSVEYKENLYDGEIAYTDHWIGKLMETLGQNGLTENTVIVLTGDHGEGLGEHSEKTHGIFIYDTTLEVPLIISCPKPFPSAKRIGSLVRLIDIAPTILEMAGCKVYDKIQGVSLLPLMQGSAEPPGLILYCESYYPQFSHNWSPLEGVRDLRWKYIEAPVRELYRVDRDPNENENILDKEPEEAKRLASLLARFKRDAAAPPARHDAQEIPIDHETKERLQSLGYVFAPEGSKTQGAYPDPKKMIGMLEHLDRGLEHSGKGDYAKARDEFLMVIEKYPQDVDAHTILGHTYEALGDQEKSIRSFEKALEFGCEDLRIFLKLADLYIRNNRPLEGEALLQEALKVNPNCTEAHLRLASLYYQRGAWDNALSCFHKAIALDPSDTISRNYIAVIYLNQKQYDKAIEASQHALKTDPNDAQVLLTLGSALLFTQRYEDALSALQKMLSIQPDSKRGHYFAGLITFQQGKTDKAIVHFTRAIQLDPQWAEPRFNLGFIYYKQGDFAQARKEFQAALEIRPDLLEARRFLEQIPVEPESD